jgi:hypothetical protein
MRSAAVAELPALSVESEENPTIVDIGEVSAERRSALAATLARILVTRTLAELGLVPSNDNR